jgi:hypothetical protein
MVMYFLNPTVSRGPEISLLLSRRGKFHFDPLTSHSMFHDTPKDYFYSHLVTEWCLVAPKCTITHSDKQ